MKINVLAYHFGLDCSLDRAEEIREEIKKKYPEIKAAGFHGTKEIDTEYPTSV